MNSNKKALLDNSKFNFKFLNRSNLPRKTVSGKARFIIFNANKC